MFNLNSSQQIPVNLVLKPIEQAIISIWLIAAAQFVNFAFVSPTGVTLEWYLTAPALMLSGLIIAIKSKNILPFFVIFLVGISAVLVFFNPQLLTLLDSNNNFYQSFNFRLNYNLTIISLYSLGFWLFFSRFLNSHYFFLINKRIISDVGNYELAIPFKKISFNLSFMTINASVLACALIGFDSSSNFSLIVFIVAILLLFMSERFVSEYFSLENVRGALLPIYMMFILMSYFNMQSIGISLNSIVIGQVLLMLAFSLWIFHNTFTSFYNRTFPDKKINTGLWPWYGLLLVFFVIFNQALESYISVYYLLILISYLFLMLRNTSSLFINWSFVLLLGWLFVMVWLPKNIMNDPLMYFGNYFRNYGQQSLLFGLSLLAFSTIWDRYLNSVFIVIGWQEVSFRKPVLFISFFISLIWLIVNSIMAFGLITGLYDLMKEDFLIDKTSMLVLVSFFALLLFVNNKVLANLLHFSAIVLLIISWGVSKVFPVYLLFALLQLAWILIPLALNGFYKRVFDNNIITTSINWVYICFIVSIICLFNALGLYDFDFRVTHLFITIAVLLISSIIMVKHQEGELWCAISYLLAMGLFVSLRLMILGTVAVNEFDTIGIFIISFTFYFINQMTSLSFPMVNTYGLDKLLPLSTLLTIPWLIGSLHSSLTLFILGVFYLIIQKQNRILQYSGFIFINMAVYLWIPMLSDYTGLLLFYVIPVMLSLLFVTHLHQNEMKKALQNKIRFIALSLFYAVITADVFLNDTLFVFTLGLLFGLSGVIYGISRKTRAFLYTGVSFMIVIILGQLMLFYPEGRLARALILMLLGATITGSMIWFNIKREMFLSKIRLFRSDLDSWG